MASKCQLKSMTKVNITQDRQSYINLIKVQHDIYWSTNAPPEKYSNSMTTKDLSGTTDQTSTHRHENQDFQPSSRARRPKRIVNHGNNARPPAPEYKQQ